VNGEVRCEHSEDVGGTRVEKDFTLYTSTSLDINNLFGALCLSMLHF
jgi:hypothetical protein